MEALTISKVAARLRVETAAVYRYAGRFGTLDDRTGRWTFTPEQLEALRAELVSRGIIEPEQHRAA